MNLYKNRDWFILLPLFVFAFLLAVWGYWLVGCADADCRTLKVLVDCGANAQAASTDRCKPPPRPLTKSQILQKSVNLVLLRSGTDFSFDRDPWQLALAQLLVPIIAILSAMKLFFMNLRRDMRVALARRSRNHTIVCGLGETGRQIVENLHRKGEPVVAIEVDGTTPDAQACEQLGIPVITGDAMGPKPLELAAVRHARAIVTATGNDSTNFEIALVASGLCGNRKAAAGPLIALPEMRTVRLIGGVTNHRRAALSSPAVEIRPFSIYEITARLLYRSSTFGRRRRAIGLKPPHVVVIGLGNTASEIVVQGIRTHFAVEGAKPKFTVIDAKGEGAAANLFAEFPGAPRVADFNFVEMTIGDAEGWDNFAALAGDDQITAVIVALADDDLNLAVGLRLRSRLDALKLVMVPVCVRLRRRRKLGDFASNLERVGPMRHRFDAFGDLGEVTNLGILFENRLDALARANHAAYLETEAGKPRSPATEPWERLPEFFKQSNRQAADYIAVNARAAGLRLRRAKEPRLLTLNADEIERMAANEHFRWSVERRMTGWRHGKVRDDFARVHDMLLPWAELPEAVRESNRARVRMLPKILSDAGIELRRERLVVGTGANLADAAAAIEAQREDKGEHLVVVIDPDDAQSCALGGKADGADISIWLRLSTKAVAALEMGGPAEALWRRAEGWVDGAEYEWLTAGPAQSEAIR